MRHEPVGLGAVHPFQCLPLLTKRGVKFVVAAALLLGAFDEGAQPVGSLEQTMLLCGEYRAIMQGVSSAASSAGRSAAMERTLSVSSAL